jgi:DNA primase large subunit
MSDGRVSIERIDELARKRIAAHFALETARVSNAPTEAVDEIVNLLRFEFSEEEEISRRALRIMFSDEKAEFMQKWIVRAEVLLFGHRLRLGLVKMLPVFVKDGTKVEFDDDDDDNNSKKGVWVKFERARELVRERKIEIMKKGMCFVERKFIKYVWFVEFEKFLERDMERARKERAFMDANDTFDVGLRDVSERLKLWRPDASDDHPMMVLATKHLLERNKELLKNQSGLKYGGHGNWGIVRRDARWKKNRKGQSGILLEYEKDERGNTISRKPTKELKRIVKVIKEGASGAQAKVFPPCMRDLMDELHVRKHMRHFKRFELNLFMKGMGLPLEEIFRVWRTAVFPHGAMSNYQNEHTYQLRHIFGLEGHMKERFEHSCSKLIKISQNEAHAARCPFTLPLDKYRALNPNEHRWKREIPIGGNREIERNVSLGDYKSACEMYFSSRHKGERMFTAHDRYPTDFFDAGIEIEDWFKDCQEQQQQMHVNKNKEREGNNDERGGGGTNVIQKIIIGEDVLDSDSDSADLEDGDDADMQFRGELIVSDSDD